MIKLTTRTLVLINTGLCILLCTVPVNAEEKTIEQMQRELESFIACKESLSATKCDMDILPPERKSLIERWWENERKIKELEQKMYPRSARGTNPYTGYGECYDSSIKKPSPFMGNSGEVFVLSDETIWEVNSEYEYMYTYYPRVVICPGSSRLIVDGKILNVRNLSGSPPSGSVDLIETSISGSWRGWKGDTIVKLTNGQIWEQNGLGLSVAVGYGNEVIIFKKNGGFFMHVEDEDDVVPVSRLK